MGISQGDGTEHLVVKHILEEYLLGGEHLLVLLAVVLGIVVAILFDRGQSARLRGIANEDVGKYRYEYGHCCRESIGTYKEVVLGLAAVEP